jgi:hypothetical protein
VCFRRFVEVDIVALTSHGKVEMAIFDLRCRRADSSSTVLSSTKSKLRFIQEDPSSMAETKSGTGCTHYHVYVEPTLQDVHLVKPSGTAHSEVGDAVTGCPDPSSCSPRFCTRPESCDTRSKKPHRSGQQTTLPVAGPSRDCPGVVIWPPRLLGSHRYLCARSHQMMA